MAELLSPRFSNDHRPSIPLSREQRAAVERFRLEKWEFEPQNCYVCGVRDFHQIAEKDCFGIEYFPGICRNCGNLQQIDYYTLESVQKLYSGYYLPMYIVESLPARFAFQLKRRGPMIYRFVEAHLAPKSKVLEIGCGAGGILKCFQDNDHIVTGWEYDEDYVAFARSMGVNVSVPPEQRKAYLGQFDIVVLSHVVEHFVDPVRELRDISLLVKEGGLLFIEVPSVHNVKATCQSDLLEYFQNAHTVHFTTSSFERVLAQVGLQPIICNDRIQALVKRDVPFDVPARGSYQETLAELHDIERTYRENGVALKRNLRRTVITALNALGLRQICRSAMLRFR